MSDSHSHSHSHSDHSHSHSHSHSHGQGGGSGDRFAEGNRAHYDSEEAAHIDDRPDFIEMAQRLSEAMRKEYTFDEEKTTVLDFACGTGLISRELAAYSKAIVGVDISQARVDQYNTRVQNQGITPDEMKAVCLELKGEEGELDGAKFDVVVCASSYHHMSSVEDITKALAYFLKPGGSLLVSDLCPSEQPIFPGDHNNVVAHQHGFDEERMRKLFEDVGLQSFKYGIVTKAKTPQGLEATWFLAQGIKPV